jgi:ABC-type nickel/cobalt efflux system permease component RcnA
MPVRRARIVLFLTAMVLLAFVTVACWTETEKPRKRRTTPRKPRPAHHQKKTAHPAHEHPHSHAGESDHHHHPHPHPHLAGPEGHHHPY